MENSTKKISKKTVKELYEKGILKDLMNYIITDGTKNDIINALHLLMSKGGDSYNITFESVPYSRGGKYKRHTSTLSSTQSWKVEQYEDHWVRIFKESTSKSAACPSVIVPKFYTEIGKQYHNSRINAKIDELKKQLL